MLAASACGTPDVAGTYVHPEEGTVVLNADQTGTITQSSDPVEFNWEQNGDTIDFIFEEEVRAQATVVDDTLVFRAGDFSGGEPETFIRSD